MGVYFRDYSDFLAERFSGKVQKLTINAGMTCPNRDGSIGVGGCSYCNNRSFSPAFAQGDLSVTRQIELGRQFFARKYPEIRYLAYFQSYTNTYGDIDSLMALYEEAAAPDDVVGIIIGTRPDCVDERLMAMLAGLNARKRVIIEFGAESSHDHTLRLVNRGHTWADTVRAVNLARRAGLDVGLHLILGLPGEDIAMMLQTVDRVNDILPDTVKFHQLQLIKGTPLALQVSRGETSIHSFEVDDYLDLCCDIVDRLDHRVAIERFTSQSPADLLIYPRWGLKNYQFTHLLINRLASCRQTR